MQIQHSGHAVRKKHIHIFDIFLLTQLYANENNIELLVKFNQKTQL